MEDMTAEGSPPRGPLSMLGAAPLQYAFQKIAAPDGQPRCVVHLESINGSFGFVWAPESLEQFGQLCIEAAREAMAGGLTIASQIPDSIPPFFQ